MNEPILKSTCMSVCLWLYCCGNALADDALKIPPCVAALKQTTSFDGRATGYAGSKSTNYLCYETCRQEGAKIRTQLESFGKASPSARLYAAELIRRLDQKAGEKVLKALLSDKTPVSYNTGGCSVETLTVGAAANRLLRNKDRLD